MKRVKLRISEEVTYEREYTVSDDFDIRDEGALEDLWCGDENGATEGFKSVDERWIEVPNVHTPAAGQLF
jgi:hypothetical protein